MQGEFRKVMKTPTYGLCAVLLLNGGPSIIPAAAAAPQLTPLSQGKWPNFMRGEAYGVTVLGNYAYLALNRGGLAIFDVSNATNCVPVGGFGTAG